MHILGGVIWVWKYPRDDYLRLKGTYLSMPRDSKIHLLGGGRRIVHMYTVYFGKEDKKYNIFYISTASILFKLLRIWKCEAEKAPGIYWWNPKSSYLNDTIKILVYLRNTKPAYAHTHTRYTILPPRQHCQKNKLRFRIE